MRVEGEMNKLTELSSSVGSRSKEYVSTEIKKNSAPTPKIKIEKQGKDASKEVNFNDQGIGKNEEQEVIKAIEEANKQFRTFDRRLEFSIHEATKEIMVKVINTENDSIIREIPSEKVLDMVAKMWEVAGILVDEKV